MSKYVIINSEAIQKRIEEWEVELQECFKAPIGEFNSHYVSTLQQAITTAGEILSHSTPLIPEIEKAWKSGEEYGVCDWADFMGEPAPINKQGYISNLKLDI